MSSSRKRKSNGSFKEVSLLARFSLLPHALHDVRVHIFASLQEELIRYNDTVGGVPIKFFDIGLAPGSKHGRIRWNDPHIFVDVRVKAILFSPVIDQVLVGKVNKIGVDYVGLLVHSLFNASIIQDDLGNSYSFDQSSESWRSSRDGDIKLGTLLSFRLKSFDHADGILSLRGECNQVLGQEDE